MGHGGWREISLGEVVLVLIPLLITPNFLIFVGFLCVEKDVNHGRANQILGVINSMTPVAMPLMSSSYLLKNGS